MYGIRRFVSYAKLTFTYLTYLLSTCASMVQAEPYLGDLAHSAAYSRLPVDQIYIEDASYQGTGCPPGRVDYVLSPEREEIAVFFDQYHVSSAEQPSGIMRKNCSFGVVLHVPYGHSVILIAMDYRGYVFVPAGAKAVFDARYVLGKVATVRTFSHQWSHPFELTEEDYYLRDELTSDTAIKSRCGKALRLQAHTQISAISNEHGDPAELQIDSLDTSAKLIYHLQWQACIS